MSSRNFRNLNRSARRGHIKAVPNGIAGGVSFFRTVKSGVVGAGDHRRWPKDMHLFDLARRQKWAPL